MTNLTGVSHTGRLVYTDTNGDREFSPRTQAAVRIAAAVFLAVVVTVALFSMVAPMPWSPLGQVVRQDTPPSQVVPSNPQPVLPNTDVRGA